MIILYYYYHQQTTTSLKLDLHSQIIIRKPFVRPNSRIQLSSSSLSLKFKFRTKSAEQFELNAKKVDKVLHDIRPYLIADGGNIDVVSIDDGIVSLKLQGACGSCPSSTTTIKMGVERVLKEKFGDAIKDISQVDGYLGQATSVTVDLVNAHLDILRPAINNHGGSVQIISIVDGDCLVEYVGPPTIGFGIQAAIKERFPDILNVHFTT